MPGSLQLSPLTDELTSAMAGRGKGAIFDILRLVAPFLPTQTSTGG